MGDPFQLRHRVLFEGLMRTAHRDSSREAAEAGYGEVDPRARAGVATGRLPRAPSRTRRATLPGLSRGPQIAHNSASGGAPHEAHGPNGTRRHTAARLLSWPYKPTDQHVRG